MYACDACDEEFDTLSALRIEHEPCPVAEERELEPGDRCRVIATGEEAEIVDVDPGGPDGDPEVLWVPAGAEDDPDDRRRASFNEIV